MNWGSPLSGLKDVKTHFIPGMTDISTRYSIAWTNFNMEEDCRITIRKLNNWVPMAEETTSVNAKSSTFRTMSSQSRSQVSLDCSTGKLRSFHTVAPEALDIALQQDNSERSKSNSSVGRFRTQLTISNWCMHRLVPRKRITTSTIWRWVQILQRSITC